MWVDVGIDPYESHDIGYAPNFIRQIFNGRKQNDSHGIPCGQETRFDGRPSGRSVYGKRNDNTHNETTCFSARKRYFASPNTLFSTIFSLAREKMVPSETPRILRMRSPAPAARRADRGVRPYKSVQRGTSLPRLRRGFAPSGRNGVSPRRGDGFAPSGHKINSPPGGPP